MTSRGDPQGTRPDTGEILALLPDVVVQVDSSGKVVEVNRPEWSMFAKEPTGDDIADLFDDQARPLVLGLIEEARRSGSARGELDTGNELYRVTSHRLRSAAVTLLVFHDLTVRRNAEQTLMELIRDKSNFLATVGRQLQNPLSAVIGFANLLVEPHPELDDKVRLSMVQGMTDQAWDLAGIVEDLLTVARADIGDLRLVDVPVNLSANAAQVIESMGERGHRILMTGNKEVTGSGDPARFRQVVRNLVSNALTHGIEPVSVGITRQEDRAVLAVTDRGPGVPEEMEAEMFSRFVSRVDAGEPGSFGIGLWLSRELASLMGGGVDYRRDHGLTTFRVWIPAIAPPKGSLAS